MIEKNLKRKKNLKDFKMSLLDPSQCERPARERNPSKTIKNHEGDARANRRTLSNLK